MTQKLASNLYQIAKWTKRYLLVLPLSLQCLAGYLWFLLTGKTPPGSFGSLRKLFYITNGRFNNLLWAAGKILNPPRQPNQITGVLGTLLPSDIDRFAAKLREEGYYIFDKRLPYDIIQQLTQYALTKPATLTEIPPGETKPGPIIYDSQNPRSSRYNFSDMQSLYECPAVQKLASDESLLAIAQAYLATEPIQDMISLWWSSSVLKGKPSPGAAQLYHFDMDRIKFLKIFFYLTDVTAETGPHCFIKGSHRRKPRGLLKDGRISDEEVAKYYAPEDIMEFVGPKGTIVAEDTSGFHKGKAPSSGERLIFQTEYAISLFGYNYAKVKINEKFSPQFIEFAQNHPHTFSNFISEQN